MKKTVSLTHPKIKRPRIIEGAKHELRKYLKRCRRRELPEDMDYWDFDCKFGTSETDSRTVHLAELDGCINEADTGDWEVFYMEAHPRAAQRKKKPGAEKPAPESAAESTPEPDAAPDADIE